MGDLLPTCYTGLGLPNVAAGAGAVWVSTWLYAGSVLIPPTPAIIAELPGLQSTNHFWSSLGLRRFCLQQPRVVTSVLLGFTVDRIDVQGQAGCSYGRNGD